MKRLGKKTVVLPSQPHIIETSSIVGKKEGEGPLAKYFDFILNDEYWGEKSFEKTEVKILKENLNKVLQKAKKNPRRYKLCISRRPTKPMYFLIIRSKRK